MLRNLFFLTCLLCTGCAPYKIPVPTSSHPACPDTITPQILLSPILEIDPKDIPKKTYPLVRE